jgi:hypothetical protein
MNMEKVLADLAALPPQAMEEAADFIAFLRARHGSAASDAPAGAKAAPDETFFGLWRDRPELSDASAWMDGLRRDEWRR